MLAIQTYIQLPLWRSEFKTADLYESGACHERQILAMSNGNF